MKRIMASILSLTISSLAPAAGTSMNMEGNCTGALADNTPVSFKYYSDFDGCKEKSKAAISFTSGMQEGLFTGERKFVGDKDVYSFPDDVRIEFADSTGNLSGTLKYKDFDDETQTVQVQCEIRDYEYAECGEA